MKNLIMAVFLAVSMGVAFGEGVSVLSQTEKARGSGLVQTTALLFEQGELWYYSGPKLVEVGQLKVVDAGKDRLSLVGGYLSFSEKLDSISLEGFGVHDRRIAGLHLHATGGFYSPRSDGSCGWIGFSPETRLTRRIGKGVEIGVAGDVWWIEGIKFDVRVGPYARKEGKDGAIAVRYFSEDKVWRAEFCVPIK